MSSLKNSKDIHKKRPLKKGRFFPEWGWIHQRQGVGRFNEDSGPKPDGGWDHEHHERDRRRPQRKTRLLWVHNHDEGQTDRWRHGAGDQASLQVRSSWMVTLLFHSQKPKRYLCVFKHAAQETFSWNYFTKLEPTGFL